jgi:hypothetical protein
MVLVVDYPGFVPAVKRYGVGNDDCVYTKRAGESLLLSYVNPTTGVQVLAFGIGKEGDVVARLESEGLCVSKGLWVTEASLEHLAQLTNETYVAAVAYETKKGPGLWIDGYATPPSEGSVLRAIFEEFVAEGVLQERAFETFIAEARPTVRILDPEDLERFVKQKAPATVE